MVAEDADPYGMTTKKSNGKSNSKKQIPCGNYKKRPIHDDHAVMNGHTICGRLEGL